MKLDVTLAAVVLFGATVFLCSCSVKYGGSLEGIPAYASPAARPIRVLLDDGKSVEVSVKGNATVASASGQTVDQGVSGTLRFDYASGKASYKGKQSPEFTVVAEEGNLGWAGREYRGKMRVVASTGNVLLVNVVEVDDYLRGVVPAEVPPTWPVEAVRAQAVAARTYAVRRMVDRASEPWDVVATTADQVYNGATAEHAESDKAVSDTAGQVLIFQGQPITAYYHADSGGFTKQGNAPYLKPVPSPAPESPYYAWVVSWTPDEFRKLLDSAKLPSGDLAVVTAVRDENGRCTGVTITTASTSFGLSANDFRKIVGISTVKSTMFSLTFEGGIAWDRQVAIKPYERKNVAGKNGSRSAKMRGNYAQGATVTVKLGADTVALGQRFVPAMIVVKGSGYGHGTGMSQWGALHMANEGRNYAEILTYYYSGVQLVQMDSVIGG